MFFRELIYLKNKKKKSFSIANEQNYILEPKDRSSLFFRKPDVIFRLKNNKEDYVNYSSFRMSINGKVISGIITSNGIEYTPRKDLKRGVYRVSVKYLMGNKEQSIDWQFNIIEHENYKCYLGVPHSHTAYSGGKGIPSDAYEMAKKEGVSFLIITEHYRALKNRASGKVGTKFSHLKKIKELDVFNSIQYEKKLFLKKNKRFLPMCGCELSTKFYGHVNILNLPKYKNINLKDIDKFYDYVKDENIVGSLNHPNKSIREVKPYKDLDKYVCLIEICNGSLSGKYNRYEETVYSLLDKGWILGVLNSQDNHKENWGKDDNLTGVLMSKLKEDHLINALKNRRTYSTESPSLCLKFSINNYPMGSILNIKKDDTINMEIFLEDKKNKIKEVQIITNNRECIFRDPVNKKSYKSNIKYKLKKEKGWILLKVILEHNRLAFSSPVFY
ncbi:hypothetical protein GCM10008909_03270 [Hathewaya limosa]